MQPACVHIFTVRRQTSLDRGPSDLRASSANQAQVISVIGRRQIIQVFTVALVSVKKRGVFIFMLFGTRLTTSE